MLVKNIVTGIFAHVDAGKTTLTEVLLYQAGSIRNLGRVDNGDAFLDNNEIEKKRGITIFSHQAILQNDALQLVIEDTPGHVDFSSQLEQVMQILDYAILVVSANDEIKEHTRKLWSMLQHYGVPTFIFVNKMDITNLTQNEVMDKIKANLADGCIAFNQFDDLNKMPEDSFEEIAMQDEKLLDEFLETGKVSEEQIKTMIQKRQVFPCFFGSALKLIGVDEFLLGIQHWSQEKQFPAEFKARVFKITHDKNGERLTWVRVLGGQISAKQEILAGQKINQLRLYNGEKFQTTASVSAGNVVALTGLNNTYPGQGLGALSDNDLSLIQPVLTYTVDPKAEDIRNVLKAFQLLSDEDPLLNVTWSSQLEEIRLQIMGKIQLEILEQILLERFGLEIGFNQGSVLYKETITHPIEGVGHFEPLRHYAEAHLIIEPNPDGGIVLAKDVKTEILPINWQNQVISNLKAKTHLGVMTGSPLTDVKITLVNGAWHNKHTEGGDFREATWRAVRQGLMMANQQGWSQLLEPWYDFKLTVPSDQVGRAMTDIQQMSGTAEPKETSGELVTLTGSAPVSKMQNYTTDVRSYTHGLGMLELSVSGYRPCHNQAEIIEERAYNPTADLENTPDSVFCAHGAGFPVKWDEVPSFMHIPYSI
ncbi:elongation factor g [Ligilactobacillus hayakitensis DSM 18933 = JCM 14209]|uniref:Elongation factor g n=1 Tax=Ligilactobacillus hayakitensis DSM 18933 = JCM 14209 TaxID=1423755 RepID=A0A0R1WND0_9LACO|nr:elongation factor g [Ligilactobacillus hayakitensis DSM 18933 = JCM 14209]